MISFPDVSEKEWKLTIYSVLSLVILGITQLFDIAWWLVKHIDMTFKITGVN